MVTLTREDALELIRVWLCYDHNIDERDLLDGPKNWLESSKLPEGRLEPEDSEFCRRWIHLSDCKSLEEVPDEFLKELLLVPANLSFLINAGHA